MNYSEMMRAQEALIFCCEENAKRAEEEKEKKKGKRLDITINFDMDGTIADLYGVENWLPMLESHIETPYEIAPPLVRLCVLARILNRLQKEGYDLAVLSWLAKGSNEDYDKRVIKAKKKWLKKHLPSVHWDKINIVAHGTPKEKFCNSSRDILFDDEEKNRKSWGGIAFDVNDIINELKKL